MPEGPNIPRIGITIGDCNGIGVEVIIRCLMDQRILATCIPVVYGSTKVANAYRKIMDVQDFTFHVIDKPGDASPKKVNLINVSNKDVQIQPGQATEDAAELAITAIDRAMDDALRGHIDGIVTAPINKSTIARIRPDFKGHTGYLAEHSGNSPYLMLMACDRLKVGLVTEHLALKEVSAAVTPERLMERLTLLDRCMVEDMGIRKPKLAVLALNPHAGEDGTLGKEEQEVMIPTINKACEKGMLVFGPYAADGFFGAGQSKQFDAILAMYHDQGLIPFKSMNFEDGVNFTAGLPYVRTSPDHGTAYDIAGKNVAHEQSFREALYMACDVVKRRRQYQQLTSNTLGITRRSSRRQEQD
ncbi:MAG: 4-hydroxythreonine-4-phosphate dehydrogenase PdxA [Flavobacteriales bacterium]|nr:4-hydroxythreonine-4-phosphate dehydrogenase PdxA [Flavobacteriales bacterium]